MMLVAMAPYGPRLRRGFRPALLTLALTLASPVVAQAPKFEGELRTLELDEPGGGAGAPMGMTFIAPAGGGETFAGDLGGGVRGLRITLAQPGDTLACTTRFPVGVQAFVKARVRVPEVKPAGGEGSGGVVEIRARNESGALVSPQGMMFVPVAVVRQAQDWGDVEAKVQLPPGATVAEVCVRLANATGTVELDRLLIIAPKGTPPEPAAGGPPAGTPAPAGTPHPSGAPLPPPASSGTPRGITLNTTERRSAVACSPWFPAEVRLKVFGSLSVNATDQNVPDWSGIVVEGYARDSLHLPLGAAPFEAIRARTEPGVTAFAEKWALPRGTAEARVCLRTSMAVASGIVDAKPG